MPSTPHPRRLLTLVALLAVVTGVMACSSSDDDAEPGDRSTTAAPSSEVQPAEDPYDGFSSEVYREGEAWICRPDLDDDACRDLDVTVIEADGGQTVVERSPDDAAPIDCFYVYPTVSADPGANSDMTVAPGDNETLTVVAQAAQFARSCRVFAPIYRQATLGAIGSGSFGEAAPIAYGDVVDAWKTYISTWNEGRGVIVIGHSQGTGHLKRLLVDEIDGNEALRSRLVAAYLFGGAVQVPEGEVVGGDLENIPACEEPDQVGCVVTWSSYPADAPPGAEAIFGRAGGDVFAEERDASARALCVDAVDLLGRERANPVAPTSAPLVGGIPGTEGLETRFVSLPAALEVSCEATEDHDYLAVAISDPADDRPLEGLVTETLGPTWGLHLVDMTVALDDLVELAAQQGAAFAE